MLRVCVLAPTPALRAGLSALLAQADPALELLDDTEGGRDEADVLVIADPEDVAALIGEGGQGVVVLSNDEAIAETLRGLPLRGWAVLPTYATAPELRAAVLAVAHGMVALPSAMAALLIAAPSTSRPIEAPRQPLTPRELEVLELVSQGLPSKLIAHALGVSESTVKYHLSSIYAKLGVASRTEAVSRAARLGLITL
ncbi:MAG: response regulator transcription factor [Chloroflexi bacterium]|jgi:DNA-binding NarL/FixJ family response regulator|nr:response regulator transcription factor [Chloroflexota bacterium]